jgi:hypothetical protein
VAEDDEIQIGAEEARAQGLIKGPDAAEPMKSAV